MANNPNKLDVCENCWLAGECNALAEPPPCSSQGERADSAALKEYEAWKKRWGFSVTPSALEALDKAVSALPSGKQHTQPAICPHCNNTGVLEINGAACPSCVDRIRKQQTGA